MNGYTTIEINGEKIGLKFGFPQYREFAIATADNLNLYFEGDGMTNMGIAKVLHTAYKNNCLVKEVKPTLSFEHFVDLVEENEENEAVLKQVAEALNVWGEAKYTKLWVEDLKKKTVELQKITQQPKKSKSNTRKSKPSFTPTASEDVS